MADQMTPADMRARARKLRSATDEAGKRGIDVRDLELVVFVGNVRAGADALDRLSNTADRGSIAFELWRSHSGSICGLDGCRYQQGDPDADYECQCIECLTTWEAIADTLLAQFRILVGGE